MVLPLLAVLFAPIAIGVVFGHLYPWAHGADWQADPVSVQRRPYLNVPFFLARAGLYGICWIGSAMLLWRGSRRHAQGYGGADFLVAISGPLLVLYMLTMGLFASTDWILSLEPDYKSTVFGLIIVAGQGVSGLCVVIGALCLLSRSLPASDAIRPDDWNDLGSVLLTVTMLWCYLVVCQFVINWMGNTQGDVGWYLQRMSNGWRVLSWILVLMHLVFPLLMLLFRRVKRNPIALLMVCGVLLAMRGLDGFWMVNASGAEATPLLWDRFSWMDVVAPVGIGAAWVAGFAWVLGRAPLMMERPVLTGAAHAA
jgi:Ni/Fe-hydrogenase subunit HybB-like protein